MCINGGKSEKKLQKQYQTKLIKLKAIDIEGEDYKSDFHTLHMTICYMSIAERQGTTVDFGLLIITY